METLLTGMAKSLKTLAAHDRLPLQCSIVGGILVCSARSRRITMEPIRGLFYQDKQWKVDGELSGQSEAMLLALAMLQS